MIRAIERWPSVPAVFGWLRLDRRGVWRLVDRGRPDFDEARDAAGSPITNEGIVDFIDRNYEGDHQGRWYWQNGPQRVYVDLDAAPLVLRVFGDPTATRLVAHTGAPVGDVRAGWIGPRGEVLLVTDIGPAVVHDLDLAALELDARPDGTVLRLCGRELLLKQTDRPAQAMGFVATPRAADGG